MDQAELLSMIGSAYDKLVADVAARVRVGMIDSVVDRLVTSGMLTTEINTRVDEKIDALNQLDKDVIREICLEVVQTSADIDIEDRISNYIYNSFDISDYESEIRELVNVRDELEDMLPDAVHECVQNLRFTVEVETR